LQIGIVLMVSIVYMQIVSPFASPLVSQLRVTEDTKA